MLSTSFEFVNYCTKFYLTLRHYIWMVRNKIWYINDARIPSINLEIFEISIADQRTLYYFRDWLSMCSLFRTDIGVFFCGPAVLSHTLHKMSNTHTNDKTGAKFYYNKENFWLNCSEASISFNPSVIFTFTCWCNRTKPSVIILHWLFQILIKINWSNSFAPYHNHAFPFSFCHDFNLCNKLVTLKPKVGYLFCKLIVM